MIDSKNCYSAFNQKSISIAKFFKENIGKLSFLDYYAWSAAPLNLDLVFQEPILKKINEQFPIHVAGILKIAPNRCYSWHQDDDRGACINMLLTLDHTSYCLFGNKSVDSVAQYDTTTLNYEKDTFYLFNNQVMHTVINFDQPRYLFSLEFREHKKNLTYQDLLQWKIDNNL
jgi:hypothetical protein